MHNVKIIDNIFKDLSKIEYALKAEGINDKVIDIINLAIIQLYYTSIYNKNNKYIINSETLSNIYFTVFRCSSLPKKDYKNIIKDIIERMSNIITNKELINE
jgi:hypothetical protein